MAESQFAQAINLAALTTLCAQLGITEDDYSRRLHRAIVKVLLANGPSKSEWIIYADALESQVNSLGSSDEADRARAGIDVAKAVVCLEAGRRADGFAALLSALVLASIRGWDDVLPGLVRETKKVEGTPDFGEAMSLLAITGQITSREEWIRHYHEAVAMAICLDPSLEDS